MVRDMAALPRVVPEPGSGDAVMSTEVLEIAAGGGQKVGVTSSGSDEGVVEDYLQGEDSEIISAFSGKLHTYCSCGAPLARAVNTVCCFSHCRSRVSNHSQPSHTILRSFDK